MKNKSKIIYYEYLVEEIEGITQGSTYKTFEKTLEKGLQEALKLIKN
jgi:hypothetical protein